VRTTIGIAIDIPEPWGGLLTRRRAQAGDPAAEHIPAHLTLLGPTEVAAGEVDRVAAHVATVAAGHAPFALHLCGTGTFRPLTEVVFVALAAGTGECRRLAAALRELPAIDRPQRYSYHPHVTVAQDVPTDALDAVFTDLAGFEAKFMVTGFTLFEHGRDGRWRPHREFCLGGAAGDGAAGDGVDSP
jgi:2'-5' RNA ligase